MKLTPIVLLLAVLADTAPAADTSTKPVPSVPRIVYMNKELVWHHNYDGGLEEARREKKLVMIDFYTSWCGWCKKLDRDVYSKKEVTQKLAQNFVAIKLNAEENEANKRLCQKFGVRGFPTIVFLDSAGNLIQQSSGYKPADAFMKLLDQVASRRK